MYDGAIIVESLRVGSALSGIPLVVTKLSKYEASATTPDQPKVWTILEFRVDAAHTEALATALAEALESPGWYADFHDKHEIFVVFPGRIFRYPRGDQASRAAAQEHGRSVGIPEPQLDWTD